MLSFKRKIPMGRTMTSSFLYRLFKHGQNDWQDAAMTQGLYPLDTWIDPIVYKVDILRAHEYVRMKWEIEIMCVCVCAIYTYVNEKTKIVLVRFQRVSAANCRLQLHIHVSIVCIVCTLLFRYFICVPVCYYVFFQLKLNRMCNCKLRIDWVKW